MFYIQYKGKLQSLLARNTFGGFKTMQDYYMFGATKEGNKVESKV